MKKRAFLKIPLKSIGRLFGSICRNPVTISLLFLLVIGTILLLKLPNDKKIINDLLDSAILSIFLNLFIFGVLISFLTWLGNRWNDIKRWKEEIDNLRDWDEKEAMFRNVGNIRRLNKYRITNIDLTGCFLKEANLSKVKLDGAKLLNTNLSGANLRDASLVNVVLNETSFTKTNLENANLEKAHGGMGGCGAAFFIEAKLFRANLKNISLYGGRFNSSSMYNCSAKGARFKECSFSKSNMSHIDMSDSLHADSFFSNCDLANAVFCRAILRGEEIHWQHGSHYQKSQFIDSNLTAADFRYADLKDVVFDGSILDRADMTTSKNLTIIQLAKAKSLIGIKIEPELVAQIKEKYSYLLKSSQTDEAGPDGSGTKK